MPLMGGKVMAEWLKTANSNLKNPLHVGLQRMTPITRQGVLETGVEFLPKPYTPATLVRKVREMLDG